MSTLTDGAPPAPARRRDAHRQPALRRRVPVDLAALGVVVAVGVVLRALTTSGLWLDEALSVAIAELPLSELGQALRVDGHPPLYYALLHGWIRLFGSGDVAVRSLSTLCSVAALPLAWVAGERIAGRRGAVAGTALLAASPFAIRYATEARMYALAVLLALAAGLLLDAALRAPSRLRLLGVALGTAALLLTHYWCAFLVAVVGAGLLASAVRGSRSARAALLAVVGGGALTLPWLPVLLYQLAHTGTPWAADATVGRVAATASAFAGGRTVTGVPVALTLAALVALALLPAMRWLAPPVRAARVLAAVGGATAALAAAVVFATDGAWVPRYASVLLPLYLGCATAGWARLRSPALRASVLGLLCVLGLLSAGLDVPDHRTNAPLVAQALDREMGSDDLVVYCPDQLAPAVNRLIGDDVRQVVFPSGERGDRVDWTDYLQRHRSAEPADFADEVVRQARGGEVFFVWADHYVGLGGVCGELQVELVERSSAHEELEISGRRQFERSTVERFDVTGPR